MIWNRKKYEMKKGDLECLDGRVLAYAEINNPCCDKHRFPALYVTDNLRDSLLYAGLEEGSIESDIIKGITGAIEQLIGEKASETKAILPIPTHLENIGAISEVEGDVIYSGESKMESLFKLLQNSINIYLDNFNNQINEIGDANDYHGENFKNKFHEYMIEYLDAVNNTEEKFQRRTGVRFARFMRNSPFSPNMGSTLGYIMQNPNEVKIIEQIEKLAIASHENDLEEIGNGKIELEKIL